MTTNVGCFGWTVENFLIVLRKKGGAVNTVVAVATAKPSICHRDDENL